MSPEHDDHSKRDAEILKMLGIFILVLSAPVIVGTFFAERGHAQVVNLIAGLVLLGIGALFYWRGRVHS